MTFALASFGAWALGISKAGFPGLGIVNVLIMVELFGAKPSLGLILPMLTVCDLIVYPMFRRYASWRQIVPLLPTILIAVALSSLLLDWLDDRSARRMIGGILLILLIIQLLREWHQNFLENLPDSRTFQRMLCFLMGMSTMLANAAGPVFSLYALVYRMTKEEFLGIGARLFLVVNLFKIPFLGNLALINEESLWLNLLLLPALFLGILSGKWLIRRVPQRLFELLLYIFSFIAGLRLLAF